MPARRDGDALPCIPPHPFPDGLESHPCHIFASHCPISDPCVQKWIKTGNQSGKSGAGSIIRRHRLAHPPHFSSPSIARNADSRNLPRGETADGVFQSFRFQNERQAWHASIVLLMPDHLHAIIAFDWETGDGMKEIIGNWKRFTARNLGIDWQRDFFDHRIRSEEDLANKWIYIRENPVRAGLVKSYEEWPHVWSPPDQRGWI